MFGVSVLGFSVLIKGGFDKIGFYNCLIFLLSKFRSFLKKIICIDIFVNNLFFLVKGVF